VRYIGSKILLLEEIENIIKKQNINAESFCDIFSGTSVVARHFKRKYRVISNDLLHFSYVLQKATIENGTYPDFIKIKKEIGKDPFDYFLNLEVDNKMLLEKAFIYENYSPNENSDRQYFTNENALKIDFIRQSIEFWFNQGLLEVNEYYYLLAGLIEAVPFISNIAGTYGAYLKHWDKRAYKKLELIKLDTFSNKRNNKSYNLDSNDLIKKIEGDILYIDPPYNKRQYAPNYHLLETISKYDYPEIYGKTGMRPYKDLKSKYSMVKEAISAFSNLIKEATFKHIIVSYSTEGIMSIEQIEEVLKTYGKKETFYLVKIPYRRYKHKSGNVKHNLHELLFYIKKEI